MRPSGLHLGAESFVPRASLPPADQTKPEKKPGAWIPATSPFVLPRPRQCQALPAAPARYRQDAAEPPDSKSPRSETECQRRPAAGNPTVRRRFHRKRPKTDKAFSFLSGNTKPSRPEAAPQRHTPDPGNSLQNGDKKSAGGRKQQRFFLHRKIRQFREKTKPQNQAQFIRKKIGNDQKTFRHICAPQN